MFMRDKVQYWRDKNRTKRVQQIIYYCYLDTTIIHNWVENYLARPLP
jgi:hypothetical protein